MAPHHPAHCEGLAPYLERELEHVYRSATSKQRARGRRWYPAARALMADLAERTGYTLEQAVAVLAITSPGAQLVTNLDWTRSALETRGAARVGRFPNQTAPKVAAVLASPELAADFVTGPKVGPFHRAILGDTDALVIDRWATAAGNVFRSQELPEGTRRALDTAYRSLARRLRRSVRDLQAQVWIAVRETTPDAQGRVRALADIV
jgi:hypothetical protein